MNYKQAWEELKDVLKHTEPRTTLIKPFDIILKEMNQIEQKIMSKCPNCKKDVDPSILELMQPSNGRMCQKCQMVCNDQPMNCSAWVCHECNLLLNS